MPAEHDISIIDGNRIVAEAATWSGTPYGTKGPGSIKGLYCDCSGSTYWIYNKASLAYPYTTAGEFQNYAAESGKFREVAWNDAQAGDILSWSDHMAVYTRFAMGDPNGTHDHLNPKTQHHSIQINDMWTATKPGGDPYHPAVAKYFKNGIMPRVYRRQRL